MLQLAELFDPLGLFTGVASVDFAAGMVFAAVLAAQSAFVVLRGELRSSHSDAVLLNARMAMFGLASLTVPFGLVYIGSLSAGVFGWLLPNAVAVWVAFNARQKSSSTVAELSLKEN